MDAQQTFFLSKLFGYHEIEETQLYSKGRFTFFCLYLVIFTLHIFNIVSSLYIDPEILFLQMYSWEFLSLNTDIHNDGPLTPQNNIAEFAHYLLSFFKLVSLTIVFAWANLSNIFPNL